MFSYCRFASSPCFSSRMVILTDDMRELTHPPAVEKEHPLPIHLGRNICFQGKDHPLEGHVIHVTFLMSWRVTYSDHPTGQQTSRIATSRLVIVVIARHSPLGAHSKRGDRCSKCGSHRHSPKQPAAAPTQAARNAGHRDVGFSTS